MESRERTAFATGISGHPDIQRNTVLESALFLFCLVQFLSLHSLATIDASVISILSTKRWVSKMAI